MLLLVWTNKFELVISSICVLILGGWYGTDGGWNFFVTEKLANQMC